jgi:5'-nucleotidase (lipoprotein e(P4) family)
LLPGEASETNLADKHFGRTPASCLPRAPASGQNSRRLKTPRQVFPSARALLPLVAAFALVVVTGCQSPAERDKRTNATVWFRGGESAALYRQGFTVARTRLDAVLAQPRPEKPLALITDIDETVLDNSPYQLWLIQNRTTYSLATWKKWTALASAEPLPGAREFLNYASSRGVKVFYVTSRDQDEADATLKNLQHAGFPDATAAHLLCKRPGVKGKEDRRQDIASTNTVCLLLGDNLSDFAAAFDATVFEERAAAVTNLAAQFGSNWIVFPNPMYGDWEKARPAGATNAVNGLDGLPVPKL